MEQTNNDPPAGLRTISIPELLAKIGLLYVENDILKTENLQLQNTIEILQKEKEEIEMPRKVLDG